MTNTIEILTKVEVSYERISDLLCTAFEGGSNYWIEEIEFVVPEKPTFTPTFDRGTPFPQYLWVPLNENGIAKIRPVGPPLWYHLGLSQIAAGLRLMASEYPTDWQDFMTENEDGDTGDTFLQLCLFSEVTFS